MQLILHAPWGGRINRAWGLALRKRFCVSFDRELQAAATDDGICISLVEQHSFPLSDVFAMLKPAILEYNLTQAALASPMFTNRWRWNATRALALKRNNGGKKIPVAIQRMRAEDLLAAVFPEQVMCQDNRSGGWSCRIIRWSKKPSAIVCTRRWISMACRRCSPRSTAARSHSGHRHTGAVADGP